MALGRVTFAIFTAVIAAGCVTSQQGEVMRADIDRLRERLLAMEERDVEAKEQVARLRSVLDQATALLTRNSADVGARVGKSESDLAKLAGQIEEAQHILAELQKKSIEDSARVEGRLAAVEQTQSKIVDKVAPAFAEDSASLWKQAEERLASGMRDEARRFFRAFVQRFPQDARAPQAFLQVGRSFSIDGKHTQAAAEFQKVLDAYPRSPDVPEAMWLLGQSFADLKFCSDAKVLFQDLAQRFPKSPRAAEARLRIRELVKIARDKRVCTS